MGWASPGVGGSHELMDLLLALAVQVLCHWGVARETLKYSPSLVEYTLGSRLSRVYLESQRPWNSFLLWSWSCCQSSLPWAARVERTWAGFDESPQCAGRPLLGSSEEEKEIRRGSPPCARGKFQGAWECFTWTWVPGLNACIYVQSNTTMN